MTGQKALRSPADEYSPKLREHMRQGCDSCGQQADVFSVVPTSFRPWTDLVLCVPCADERAHTAPRVEARIRRLDVRQAVGIALSEPRRRD